jgi:hypothetical protein
MYLILGVAGLSMTVGFVSAVLVIAETFKAAS